MGPGGEGGGETTKVNQFGYPGRASSGVIWSGERMEKQGRGRRGCKLTEPRKKRRVSKKHHRKKENYRQTPVVVSKNEDTLLGV